MSSPKKKTEWTNAEIMDMYNGLLLSHDNERMRKLLVRYEFYKMVRKLPGDIVECGVFKGTGLLLFLKFLSIFSHASTKKVIGFDVFEDVHTLNLEGKDKEEMDNLYKVSDFDGFTCEQMQGMADRIQPGRVELVKGNICQTAKKYVEDPENVGMRISLLHLDLDVYEPTKAALEALWDRVVPGGVVVLDEYALGRWSESKAVDEFFRSRSITPKIKTFEWARTPTAYIKKKTL